MPNEDAGLIFYISTIDIYALQQSRLCEDTFISLSVDLMWQGYIGNTLLNPSYAISIKTLELYWQLCMRKLSFSAKAYVKVICNIYSVSLVHILFR